MLKDERIMVIYKIINKNSNYQKFILNFYIFNRINKFKNQLKI